MKKYLEENNFSNIDFLYNNSYEYDNHIIAGTRGWGDKSVDSKILNREMQRLELSIQDGISKYGKEIIVCMHYPPIDAFLEIMKKYNVKRCLYGHLHGESHKNAVEGNIDGIEMKCVSADYVNFEPYFVE